jgi:hypothetical protein
VSPLDKLLWPSRPLAYRVGYVIGWALVWAFLLALTVGPAVLVWTMGGVE